MQALNFFDIDKRLCEIADKALLNCKEKFNEIDEIVRQNCPDIYVPKYYVKRDEIPITEVNKKINFKLFRFIS